MFKKWAILLQDKNDCCIWQPICVTNNWNSQRTAYKWRTRALNSGWAGKFLMMQRNWFFTHRFVSHSANISFPQNYFSVTRSWRGCMSSRNSVFRSTSRRRKTSSSHPATSASVSRARGVPSAGPAMGPRAKGLRAPPPYFKGNGDVHLNLHSEFSCLFRLAFLRVCLQNSVKISSCDCKFFIEVNDDRGA